MSRRIYIVTKALKVTGEEQMRVMKKGETLFAETPLESWNGFVFFKVDNRPFFAPEGIFRSSTALVNP